MCDIYFLNISLPVYNSNNNMVYCARDFSQTYLCLDLPGPFNITPSSLGTGIVVDFQKLDLSYVPVSLRIMQKLGDRNWFL